jgi:ferritin-like metal-binding protein YciE
MKKPNDTAALPQVILAADKLKSFFLAHLNRIYCSKSHLAERFPDLALNAHFSDLKHVVNETLEDVEKQIARMGEIYVLLDAQYSFEKCNGLIGMIEEAYDAIHEQNDSEMRDLAILFYLQHIDSVEMSSFKALQMIALKLKDKQVEQLLLENFDDAKNDRALLVAITQKYLNNQRNG